MHLFSTCLASLAVYGALCLLCDPHPHYIYTDCVATKMSLEIVVSGPREGYGLIITDVVHPVSLTSHTTKILGTSSQQTHQPTNQLKQPTNECPNYLQPTHQPICTGCTTNPASQVSICPMNSSIWCVSLKAMASPGKEKEQSSVLS